ncbi:hypothetical protein G7046_g6012 [Stylonectria norvegica]|nr:hypothetical protein G7046_g6012 [Stylonectria norvegica]
MAKVKPLKGAKAPQGVTNRHIYSRASYLYQAATYLASKQAFHDGNAKPSEKPTKVLLSEDQEKAMQNTARQMISDLRAVTLKTQIRQSPAMKRTICKFCNTLQIEGQTCVSTVENPSKGGRKPWADVLTIRCTTCGHAKRYPVNASRQKRREARDEDTPMKMSGEEALPFVAYQKHFTANLQSWKYERRVISSPTRRSWNPMREEHLVNNMEEKQTTACLTRGIEYPNFYFVDLPSFPDVDTDLDVWGSPTRHNGSGMQVKFKSNV